MSTIASHGPAFLGVSYSLPLLVITGILLIELLSRIGAGPVRLTGYRPNGPLDLFGTSFLPGILTLGTAFLGLALTGLFFSPVVLVVTLAVAAIGGGYKGFPGFVIPAVRSAANLPGRWYSLLATPALVPFLTAASPYLDEDSLIYHLAFPWQCLQIHRIPIDNVIVLFHFPLPADLAFALPLILGDDRLAKWMIAGSVAALCAFVAGRVRDKEGVISIWLTPLIAFASSYMFFVSEVPKNDLVAAGFLVVGALLWRRGPRNLGALMLGGAMAVKLTCGPFVAAWLLLHPPRWRRTTGQAALLILPILPWLAKTWLVTGNPVFPIFWKLIPSPFWGPENQAAFDNFNMWAPGAESMRTLLPALLRVMWNDFILCLIALPVLFRFGSWRSATALTIGFAGVLHLGGIARYLLPGILLVSAEIARMAGRAGPGRTGKWLRTILILGSIIQIFRSWHAQPPHWRDIFRPAESRREQYLSTYATAIRDLGRVNCPRIMVAGGWRSYLLPGRVLFNGYQGETPLIWSQVRSSPSPERLRRRLRQFGFRVMLYNFVSGDLVFSLNRSFVWTDSMLRMYSGLCRRRLSILRHPGYIDAANGGFYQLGYDFSPREGPVRPLFFLPTAESALWTGRSLTVQNRFPEARREIERVLATTGEVGHFVSYLAEASYFLQDWSRVHALLAPYYRTGMADNLNLPRLGEAAAQLGRYDEAVAILKRCLVLYGTVMPNRVILAWTYGKRAQLRMRENRLSDARADLDRADETIFAVPSDPGESYESSRILAIAELLGTRGDLLEAQGRPREALDCYRKALKLVPEAPEFRRWQQKLKAD